MIPNKTRLRFFILLAVALTLSACIEAPHQYSAEATTAKVVDADTKKPIAGVIVTANWQLEQGTVGGNVPVGQIMVMEAVTDKDGKFTFPAWGPKWTFKGHLVIDDPQLLLFKGGYEYRRLQNEVTTRYNKGSLRHSDWNGKTIEMKPFKGTMEEWADHLSSLKISLYFVEDDCNWKKTPRTILALDKEVNRLREAGFNRSIYSIEYLPTKESECGSSKKFFESYKP